MYVQYIYIFICCIYIYKLYTYFYTGYEKEEKKTAAQRKKKRRNGRMAEETDYRKER